MGYMNNSSGRRSVLKKCGIIGTVGVAGAIATGTVSASHTRKLTAVGKKGHTKYYFVVSNVVETDKLEGDDTITELDNGYTAVEGEVTADFFNNHKDIYWIEGKIHEVRMSHVSGFHHTTAGLQLEDNDEYTSFNRLKFRTNEDKTGAYECYVPPEGDIQKHSLCEGSDDIGYEPGSGDYCKGSVSDGIDIYSKSNNLIKWVAMKPKNGQTITMEHYYD